MSRCVWALEEEHMLSALSEICDTGCRIGHVHEEQQETKAIQARGMVMSPSSFPATSVSDAVASDGDGLPHAAKKMWTKREDDLLREQEDMLIVKYQATYGNRWSTIAEFLSGRTDNAIKNRWNSVLHKHAPSLQAETCATARECLEMFPLAPGDIRANAAAAAPPSDMTCGVGDPLTELRLWSAARVVFDVMPLQAYRM
uniref:Uncharacterized protein n=1 Tax=Aegilops tauschii TaxID=37682 RepID=M8BLT4_AEGTA